MKKKTVILIILVILVISSITYAYSQNNRYSRGRINWGRNRIPDEEFYGWEEDYNRSYNEDSISFRRGPGCYNGHHNMDFSGHHRGFHRAHRNYRGWGR